MSLVGPSGSGKSTLMMVIGGLERPSAGRVRIDGYDLGALNEDALARLRRDRIGIVFQAFHLIPTMTALENVALPLELGGRRDAFEVAAQASRRSASTIAWLIIPGSSRAASSSAWRSPAPSSPGQSCSLADEPTGNLDAATGRLVIDCLFEHQARHGTTLAPDHPRSERRRTLRATDTVCWTARSSKIGVSRRRGSAPRWRVR